MSSSLRRMEQGTPRRRYKELNCAETVGCRLGAMVKEALERTKLQKSVEQCWEYLSHGNAVFSVEVLVDTPGGYPLASRLRSPRQDK